MIRPFDPDRPPLLPISTLFAQMQLVVILLSPLLQKT